MGMSAKAQGELGYTALCNLFVLSMLFVVENVVRAGVNRM